MTSPRIRQIAFPFFFQVSILALSFSLISCNGENNVEPSILVNPQNLNPTIILGDDSASVTIDPAAGGRIELTDTDGNSYTLDIPAFAIVGHEAVSITATALESVDNFPAEMSFITGLEITPNNISLVRPVTLTVAISGTVTSEVIGFNQFQNNRFFIPVTTPTNSQGYAELYHFGRFIAFAIPDYTECQVSPGQNLDGFLQHYACLRAFYGEDLFDEDEELRTLAEDWLDFIITRLQGTNTPEDFRTAIANYNAWYFISASGLDEHPATFPTAIDLLSEKIALARDLLNQECINLSQSGQSTDRVMYDFRQLRTLAGITRSERLDLFMATDLEIANFCQ